MLEKLNAAGSMCRTDEPLRKSKIKENKEKQSKQMKSETLSSDKTQNTVTVTFQTIPETDKKPSLVLNKRSKSNVNELHLMLMERSLNSDSDSSSKIDDKDDVFDKELKISSPEKEKQEKQRMKNHLSQQKDNHNNLRIFQRLIESESFSPVKKICPAPNENSPEAYLNHSIVNREQKDGMNNSTFVFDPKKDNDVVLCVSNIKNNNDFLEESIDSNFKKDFLTLECLTSKHDKEETTKIESENSNNNSHNIINTKEDTEQNITAVAPRLHFIRKHKLILGAAAAFGLILLSIVLIKVIV